MDQLTFASLSHIHYWYEVGMLKVPAYGGTIERRAADSKEAKRRKQNKTKQNKRKARERRHDIYKPQKNGRRIRTSLLYIGTVAVHH